MNRTIWGAVAYDPKVVTIWEGVRRYFHEEADRFNSDVGKHGDTGRSEVEVVRGSWTPAPMGRSGVPSGRRWARSASCRKARSA